MVIAFGQKLSPRLLAATGSLTVNLHASLLPAYRGAAPINWAMIHGETRTGVSVIGLAQRMDAGVVYRQAALAIDPSETAGELHDRLAELGPEVILGTLADHEAGRLEGIAQDDALASKAPKLSKSDGTVNFAQSAVNVRNRVHGLTPWPGCRVIWRPIAGGQDIVLTLHRVSEVHAADSILAAPGTLISPRGEVATQDHLIQLAVLQMPGCKVLTFEHFTNGRPFAGGDQLLPLTS